MKKKYFLLTGNKIVVLKRWDCNIENNFFFEVSLQHFFICRKKLSETLCAYPKCIPSDFFFLIQNILNCTNFFGFRLSVVTPTHDIFITEVDGLLFTFFFLTQHHFLLSVPIFFQLYAEGAAYDHVTISRGVYVWIFTNPCIIIPTYVPTIHTGLISCATMQ